MANSHNLVNKPINILSKQLCFSITTQQIQKYLQSPIKLSIWLPTWLSGPCTTGSSQDHLWLSWPIVFIVAPLLGIRPLYLIQPTKQSLIWVAPLHGCLRYLVLNFQDIVVHFKHIHFCLHKHQWPLPISTCYDVTHPVESQYHQHWSFFVVPSISLLRSPQKFFFTTNSKIDYWCAGCFSISFGNTDLVYQTHRWRHNNLGFHC